MPHTPLILCILDGWGVREAVGDNAIAAARTPYWDALVRDYPMSTLDASEQFVGLPKGQMGNSEVGHMNIGAGRVVMQDLPRIDAAIANGSLAENAVLQDIFTTLHPASLTTDNRQPTTAPQAPALHLLGLLSPGGVHAHQAHILALARIASEAGVPVWIHAITDGRDTPPQSAADTIAGFQKEIDTLPGVHFATVSGRYYAMDRDQRWERTEAAYCAIVHADAPRRSDAVTAVQASYDAGNTDEFILPVALEGYPGMHAGDAVIFANFRADRARQISAALADPAFAAFDRGEPPALSVVAGMTQYSAEHAAYMPALFPPQTLTHGLGQVVAEAGLKQLRIAETEKYAHVTFFFNGGREAEFDGEDRVLVPSPKVATYDLQPAMSAPEMTDRLVDAVGSGAYGLIVVNYANTDMVGHTGKFDAAVDAVEAVDACLGRLKEAVDAAGGVLVVTADHGNAEQMRDPETGQPHTAHTLNPVPFLVAGPGVSRDALSLKNGRLADIAPTVLHLMGLERPTVMTGSVLTEE